MGKKHPGISRNTIFWQVVQFSSQEGSDLESFCHHHVAKTVTAAQQETELNNMQNASKEQFHCQGKLEKYVSRF